MSKQPLEPDKMMEAAPARPRGARLKFDIVKGPKGGYTLFDDEGEVEYSCTHLCELVEAIASDMGALFKEPVTRPMPRGLLELQPRPEPVRPAEPMYAPPPPVQERIRERIIQPPPFTPQHPPQHFRPAPPPTATAVPPIPGGDDDDPIPPGVMPNGSGDDFRADLMRRIAELNEHPPSGRA